MSDDTRDWWEVPPREFAAAARDYNGIQKTFGESELPPEVRRHLLDLETRQYRHISEIPKRG